jgi:hypothetical protein
MARYDGPFPLPLFPASYPVADSNPGSSTVLAQAARFRIGQALDTMTVHSL